MSVTRVCEGVVMNCAEAQEQLSALHDGELTPLTGDRTREHVENCSNCNRALTQLEAISSLAQRLSDPEPPADLWLRIEDALVVRPADASSPASTWRRMVTPLMAASVTMLVAVGWFLLEGSDSPQHARDPQLARHFGKFVDRFQSEPDAATQILLTNYAGQRVSASRATTLLGYQPVATRRLPPAYSLEAVYVLEMACCRCPQTVYRRDTGGVIAIFEHNEPQPDWFGERPQIAAHCSGVPARLVQLDTLLAATWQHNRRYFTVIGAKDIQEISLLINHFRLLQNELLPTS